MSTDIVKYEYAGKEITLTAKDVMGLVNGGGRATDAEVTMFLELCKYRKLNPFIKDAYLVKYGTTPATTIVSYDVFRKRADENPLHVGVESGIVVDRKGTVVQKNGACIYPNEKLIGGWARVTKAKQIGGAWRDTYYYKEVSFGEYNTGKSNWAKMPSMMIEKVAVSQALRAAYPNDFQGLYTAEEMNQAEPKNAAPAQNTTTYAPQKPPEVVNVPFTVSDQKDANIQAVGEIRENLMAIDAEQTITREQANEFVNACKEVYGEKWVEFVNRLLEHNGWKRMGEMPVPFFTAAMEDLLEAARQKVEAENREQDNNGLPVVESFDELAENEEELPFKLTD